MTETLKKKISSNIWKMTVLFVANKRPYMTFLTIFLLTMPNTTAQTIGLLTLVGQITGFIFEIPSGYVADRIGHRNTLIISRAFFALSTLCYVLANNMYWFFAGAILLAFGFSFASGTSSAFMHETLTALKQEKRYAEIMGKMRSLGFAIPIALILILPIIAETSFRLAFGVMLIIDLIALVTAILLTNPKVKQQEIKEVDIHNFFSIFNIFIKMKWSRYAIISSLAFGIALGSTAGFKNPYQELLGLSLTTIGFLWATSRIFISLLLLTNGKVYKLLTFKQFVILQILIYTAAFMVIGLSSNIWVIASMFILTTTTMFGFSAARSQYDMEIIKDSNVKATLLSIVALIKNIFTGLTGLGVGILITSQGYSFNYSIVGISLFVVALLAALTLNKNRQLS